MIIDMSRKTAICHLLYLALVEIRARESDPTPVYRLTDVFHTVPLRLAKAETEADYDQIFEDLMIKAEQRGLTKVFRRWLAEVETKEDHPSDAADE